MLNQTDTTRNGDSWVQTYTGKAFWPLDPRPEDVDIEDAKTVSVEALAESK